MTAGGQRFQVLAGAYAVCRLEARTAIPTWAVGDFVSITSTADELSVICPAERVPIGVVADRDWRVLKLVGPYAFSTVGVLASVATPLAQAGISLLVTATYDTDYVLVKAVTLTRAVAALVAAGHVRAD